MFSLRTDESFPIKVLAELLANNLKTGFFEIDANGISLRRFDHHRKTLIDLSLESKNFNTYSLQGTDSIHMGINLNYLHKMLKCIKKKDILQLSIDSPESNELNIFTISKNEGKSTESTLKIHRSQNLEIDLPEGYVCSFSVDSSEFHKMRKDILEIGSSVITVSACNHKIKFSANADEILKRSVTFGDTKSKNKPIYEATFPTDQISRISKIAGLNSTSTVQIFVAPNLPLMFKANVGVLGVISVYIKSNEMVEQEKMIKYEESDDE